MATNITFSVLLFLLTSTLSHASRSRTTHNDDYTPSPPSYTSYYSYQDGPHYTNPSYTYQDKPYYTTQTPPSPTYEPNHDTQPPYSPTYHHEQNHDTQPPPSPTYSGGGASGVDKEAFLQVHNMARAAVGLPPLVWDDKVAAFAQSWANQRINDCRMIHSNTDYGENIFWGSGKYSAAFATQSWVNERKYYDYGSNSCKGGMDCGHYTQIIWKKSTRLGCARVVCNNGGVFVTCNYDPAGNYVGQRPY